MSKCYKIKICETCNLEYNAKTVTSRFCSRSCMYVWRKNQNWEFVLCVGCPTTFRRRKNEKHYRTGLPRQYCSNACSLTSVQKKEKLRSWANSNKNHWNDPSIQSKVRATKLKKYGDATYNNMDLYKITCTERYGVPYAIVSNKLSNGKRISNPQLTVFNKIVEQHPDAELEKWLNDAQKSVDIYIPSKNKIIEVHGTYWHCDPRKYQPDFYNKSVHMSAHQIWRRDADRKKLLESLGYAVEIVWELDTKNS